MKSSGSDDSEDEQGYLARKQEVIPDAVDHFLGELLQGLQTRNALEIHRLYEDTFNKLTDKFYKNTRWPSVKAVQDTVSEEPLFIILYKELSYRHIYARLNPVQFEDRVGSWENYCRLLDLIIEDMASDEADEDLSVALPAQWLWDILDEFVYHFQTYSTYRNKTGKLGKEKDVSQLRENPQVFDTTQVLNYLHKLIRFSLIEEWLAHPENPQSKNRAFTDETCRLIGYFALMQLLRMHCLLGDYRLAMQTIECVDFQAEVPLFYRIPASHVTVYYYMGFSYLMMRR